MPAGKAHKFANGVDGVARANVQVTPALDMEVLFETACALAEEGCTRPSGMPTPLHLALFVHRFRDEVEAPFPPAWVQRAALKPLAVLATALSHGERYERSGAAPRKARRRPRGLRPVTV